ncbi:hypothetical protein LEN26_018434 [Aphanomyces euteiches]|nr:hypothetical protein LEN26_018434 [Aphanomyces euteiches]KAH9192722.1 hypothetical protein AeNC1_005300 [Aphanomyces euteiches]
MTRRRRSVNQHDDDETSSNGSDSFRSLEPSNSSRRLLSLSSSPSKSVLEAMSLSTSPSKLMSRQRSTSLMRSQMSSQALLVPPSVEIAPKTQPSASLMNLKLYLFGNAPFLVGAMATTRAQANLPSHDITELFPAGQPLAKLSAGYEWGAALVHNHVHTWGNNTSGQLGHGHTDAVAHPTVISSLLHIQIVKISCGSAHGGFVSDEGELFMVGDATYGRLGLGSAVSTVVSTPQKVSWSFADCRKKTLELGMWPFGYDEKADDPSTTATFFSDVSCGDRHTLVLVKQMHTLRQVLLSFGDGNNGRLGVGTDIDHWTPCLMSHFHTAAGHAFPPIREMTAGVQHNACITHTGEIFTWGYGAHGELGHKTQDSVWTPKRVEFFFEHGNFIVAKQVACGAFHTVAVDTAGRIFAWGRGDAGQLGVTLSTAAIAPSPLEISFPKRTPPITARAVAAGRQHTLVIDSLDNVHVWGSNRVGQLGIKEMEGGGAAEGVPPTQWTPASMHFPANCPPIHVYVKQIVAAEDYSMVVLRAANAFESSREMDRARKAAAKIKMLQGKKAQDAPSPRKAAAAAAATWSFSVTEPTDELDIPSQVDRFVAIMAATKLAKRPPSAVKSGVHHAPESSPTASAVSKPEHAVVRAEKRRLATPNKGDQTPIRGLLQWRAARFNKTPSKRTTTFGYKSRFPIHPLVESSSHPQESAAAIPTERQKKRSVWRNAFGVGARFASLPSSTSKVSTTPGPGAYDIPKSSPRKLTPSSASFGSKSVPQHPLPVAAPSNNPESAASVHLDRANPWIYPTPPSVKFGSSDDFSKVIQKRLAAAGARAMPGPGTYDLDQPWTKPTKSWKSYQTPSKSSKSPPKSPSRHEKA